MKLSSLSSIFGLLLLIGFSAISTPAKATTNIVGDLAQTSELKWTTTIASNDKLYLYMGGWANLATG